MDLVDHLVPQGPRFVVRVVPDVRAQVHDLRRSVHTVGLGTRCRVRALPAGVEHVAVARTGAAACGRAVIPVGAGLEIDERVLIQEVDLHEATLGRPDGEPGAVGAFGHRAELGCHLGPRNRQPSGGTVNVSDHGIDWSGVGCASAPPRLPTPLPPYSVASLLSSSRQ